MRNSGFTLSIPFSQFSLRSLLGVSAGLCFVLALFAWLMKSEFGPKYYQAPWPHIVSEWGYIIMFAMWAVGTFAGLYSSRGQSRSSLHGATTGGVLAVAAWMALAASFDIVCLGVRIPLFYLVACFVRYASLAIAGSAILALLVAGVREGITRHR